MNSPMCVFHQIIFYSILDAFSINMMYGWVRRVTCPDLLLDVGFRLQTSSSNCHDSFVYEYCYTFILVWCIGNIYIKCSYVDSDKAYSKKLKGVVGSKLRRSRASMISQLEVHRELICYDILNMKKF